MSNENVNKIEFDYNDKHYCLEYTPDSLARMEAQGFAVDEVFTRPNLRIPQLWDGAFMAHEPRTSSTIKKKIYEEFKSKKLIQTLYQMYNNVTAQLVPDIDDIDDDNEGNAKWRALP